MTRRQARNDAQAGKKGLKGREDKILEGRQKAQLGNETKAGKIRLEGRQGKTQRQARKDPKAGKSRKDSKAGKKRLKGRHEMI